MELRVADKSRIRKDLWELKRVATWQLVIILVLVGFLAATFLRLNNIGMDQRRQALYAADKAGDATTIANRLADLQRYVNSHMNADTGAVYLQNEYNRDAQAATKAAAEADTINTSPILKAAVDTCHAKYPYDNYGSTVYGFRQCVGDELAKVAGAPDLDSAIKLPNPDLYRYSFAAPLWSPDFAGWTLVVCVAILLVIVIRLLGILILNLMLKVRYRGV